MFKIIDVDVFIEMSQQNEYFPEIHETVVLGDVFLEERKNQFYNKYLKKIGEFAQINR